MAITQLFPNADKAEILASQACNRWGIRLLPWMVDQMANLLISHEYDLLIEGIFRTSYAPRPSWAYFLAIIRNWDKQNITNVSEMEAANDRFRSHRNTRTVSAQQYGQRDYTEKELNAVSGDLIAEARRYAAN